SIVKSFESLLPVWFVSPAKVADAVAVPAFVLFVYVTDTDWFSPPAPVTLAVHGVYGEPVYTNGPGVQLTVVVLPALSIVKVVEPLLLLWLPSPPKAAEAVAVPAFVLFA